MILSLIKIDPHPRTRREIMEILRNAEFLTRTKTGCLGAAVYVKKCEEEVILYLEQWQSREDFERHIKSPLYNRLLAAMDLSVAPPEVSFQEGTDLGGMEVIKAIRNQKAKNNEVMKR